MALNSLYCADVPLSNYSLTHSLTYEPKTWPPKPGFYVLEKLNPGLHRVLMFVGWAKNMDGVSSFSSHHVVNFFYSHCVALILTYF